MMTEEQEVADRNFRSAYYKSLGVKGSEKSVTHLEVLLKAEVFDVKKLKLFCLKHTLTVFYRPLVWKIILSVIPVFTDKDVCSFIEEQKRIEFHDLKHALEVMGRLENARPENGRHSGSGGGGMSSISKPPNTLTIPKLSPPSHHAPKQPLPSLADPSQSQRHSSHLQPSQPIPTPQSRSSLRPHPIKTPNCSTAQLESYVIIPEVGPPNHQSLPPHEHRVLSQSPPATPRDFVTLFLLENNRLLSASVHQLKWEEQVNLVAIAEAFFVLFKQESEDSIYWLFSNFIKKLESHLAAKEDMVQAFIQILEDIDCALLEHIKDLNGLEDTVPIERWFCQCYAKDLPESCIESLWDRVIGGSCMVLVYMAVSVLLAFKRKIFGFTSAEQLKYLLNHIPKDHFTPILNKAIGLWESHGSPLVPAIEKTADPFSDELCEIEDYT